MSELVKSPSEIFNPDNPNIRLECINGYDVPLLKLSDEHGGYFAIPALNMELSNICGHFVCEHMIREIDYDTYNGEVAIIKAYY